tara:strand:+ start:608 stop:805 length:198 start_codon:yes stop_codon:yes gene_type:complete
MRNFETSVMIWEDAQFISVIDTLPQPAAEAEDIVKTIPEMAPRITKKHLRIWIFLSEIIFGFLTS